MTMNKTNLIKTLVALMIYTAGTTAYAGDAATGGVNGRNALDDLLLHVAQKMMERKAAPTEQVSTVSVKKNSAKMAKAKAESAPMVRTQMVASNN